MTTDAKTIHWLGAGLASVPGIRRLIAKDYPLKLWERDLDKAILATRGLAGQFEICESKDGALESSIQPGDVVVSMLPTAMHPSIARLCLELGAHFVSSSYTGPDMLALDSLAKEKGLVLINEVGLDPGIDHLLAHLLMDDYRKSSRFDPSNDHDFQSYCGGFPAVANDFKYKFSWSPLGVLKALKSPARAIKDGRETVIDHPWDAVEDYPIELSGGFETFQSYPNRDSLPFMAEYGIGKDWNVSRFVRGTLRLAGWSEAWADIFKTIETTHSEHDDTELAQLSDRLWADHAYHEGERDRVVMSVELKVTRNGQTLWHKAKSLDSYGTNQASAMGRLVSIPVSLAVEAICHDELTAGIQAAPHNPAVIRSWLETIAEHGDMVHHTDYCLKARMEAAE